LFHLMLTAVIPLRPPKRIKQAQQVLFSWHLYTLNTRIDCLYPLVKSTKGIMNRGTKCKMRAWWSRKPQNIPILILSWASFISTKLRVAEYIGRSKIKPLPIDNV